jgi:hypothetical protein
MPPNPRVFEPPEARHPSMCNPVARGGSRSNLEKAARWRDSTSTMDFGLRSKREGVVRPPRSRGAQCALRRLPAANSSVSAEPTYPALAFGSRETPPFRRQKATVVSVAPYPIHRYHLQGRLILRRGRSCKSRATARPGPPNQGRGRPNGSPVRNKSEEKSGEENEVHRPLHHVRTVGLG